MAFRASKVRRKANAEPLGRGVPIHPSAGIAAGYRSKVNPLVKAMLEDYNLQISLAFEDTKVAGFFGMDASVSDVFKTTMNSLRQRWSRIFTNFGAQFAPEFVSKVESGATSAVLNSLSVAGLKAPTKAYNENVKNVIESSVNFNHTLITNIGQQAHERIYSAVMLSLTSPNPEEQGLPAIRRELKKAGIEAKERVKLIARDQTSKIYSSLADERMRQNGCEEFEWVHSSAGKVPRPDHVAKNGMIFKLNDPRLWEGKKADQGPPGWAINCRCTRVPVFR